ncbi:MAG: LytR C-terminal domain-containing protein [Acidimicrobiales bacterium]
MTAPEPRPAGRDSNARGLVVILVAVVVGVLLLSQIGKGSGSSAKTTSKPPSTTAPLDSSETTEATTTTSEASTDRSPSEVKVTVLNGSGKPGAAAATSDQLDAAGYTMGTPGNAPTTTPQTTIYYADGYKADAVQVATTLGKGTDSVKPLGDASLGTAAGDANVVVVLGADTPAVSTTTSTSTPG